MVDPFGKSLKRIVSTFVAKFIPKLKIGLTVSKEQKKKNNKIRVFFFKHQIQIL